MSTITNFEVGEVVCIKNNTNYDTPYESRVFKRGDRFIIISKESDKIDCYLFGTTDVYTFSPDFLVKNTLRNRVYWYVLDHPKIASTIPICILLTILVLCI